MIIGLTGGIASGKSTVSKMLGELGLPIVDADIIARQVVERGEDAYQKIVKQFGEDILTDEGNIDRKKLGAIIFANSEKRKLLNEIVHPAVRAEMKRQIDKHSSEGHERIVLDIPLLFESNLQSMVDKIIVVYIPKELQLQRLMKRDGSTEEEALQRIQSQMPIEEKKSLADAVLHNSGSIEETKEQLIQLFKKM